MSSLAPSPAAPSENDAVVANLQQPAELPSHTFLGRFWLQCCAISPGMGAMLGYSLSMIFGVALVVLCLPQLWRLGYGEIKGLCFGCAVTPVFQLVLHPWNAIALACLYLNGLIAGLYGIYQSIVWSYTGGRRLRRQLLRQRRQQECR